MRHIFNYRDSDLYCRHTVDPSPDQDEYPMHAHERMEVFCFLSGSGSYLVEGNQYPLHRGDILIMRAAETHKLLISPSEPYEGIAIHFTPELLLPVDPERRLLRPFLERPLGRGNLYPADAPDSGRLRIAFSHFSFEGISDLRLNLFSRLLIFLTALESSSSGSVRSWPSPQGIQQELVAYVNEHLFEDISLQSVADAFFRSRSQIARIFQQATGSPLWEYVTIKRLFAAQTLIRRGVSAGEAGAACGFSDYSTFYRAYRARFRHSPREDANKQL